MTQTRSTTQGRQQAAPGDQRSRRSVRRQREPHDPLRASAEQPSRRRRLDPVPVPVPSRKRPRDRNLPAVEIHNEDSDSDWEDGAEHEEERGRQEKLEEQREREPMQEDGEMGGDDDDDVNEEDGKREYYCCFSDCDPHPLEITANSKYLPLGTCAALVTPGARLRDPALRYEKEVDGDVTSALCCRTCYRRWENLSSTVKQLQEVPLASRSPGDLAHLSRLQAAKRLRHHALIVGKRTPRERKRLAGRVKSGKAPQRARLNVVLARALLSQPHMYLGTAELVQAVSQVITVSSATDALKRIGQSKPLRKSVLQDLGLVWIKAKPVTSAGSVAAPILGVALPGAFSDEQLARLASTMAAERTLLRAGIASYIFAHCAQNPAPLANVSGVDLDEFEPAHDDGDAPVDPAERAQSRREVELQAIRSHLEWRVLEALEKQPHALDHIWAVFHAAPASDLGVAPTTRRVSAQMVKDMETATLTRLVAAHQLIETNQRIQGGKSTRKNSRVFSARGERRHVMACATSDILVEGGEALHNALLRHLRLRDSDSRLYAKERKRVEATANEFDDKLAQYFAKLVGLLERDETVHLFYSSDNFNSNDKRTSDTNGIATQSHSFPKIATVSTSCTGSTFWRQNCQLGTPGSPSFGCTFTPSSGTYL